MIKIRIGGWAGQGTVLAGRILATSLALEQDMYVVQKRSYSAAVRSGISYSDIIADEEPLDELVVDVPDYLVILYQKTLDEWNEMACNSGTLILDSTRVKTANLPCDIIEVPAGDMAEELGTSKAANMVLLGVLAGLSSQVELDALKRAVQRYLPSKYVDMNIKALQRGYEFVTEGKP